MSCTPNPCPRNKFRLPCEWIKIIQDRLNNPTGKWRDYNCTAIAQMVLDRAAHDTSGILCRDDVPVPPVPSDYSDLESPGDLNCG